MFIYKPRYKYELKSSFINEKLIRQTFLLPLFIKGKLELVTGASASSMILEVYNQDKEFVCAMTNDNALLGSFPIDDGMRIHVIFTLHCLIIRNFCIYTVNQPR